jgi:hypothetical protein
MNFLPQQGFACNQNLSERYDGSWVSLTSLIFEIVADQQRMMLRRKALGRRKRRVARRQARRGRR